MNRAAAALSILALAACGGNVVVDGTSDSSGSFPSSSGTGAGIGAGAGSAGSGSHAGGAGGTSASSMGGGMATSGGSMSSAAGMGGANGGSSSGVGAAAPCGSLYISADPDCQTCALTNCCSELLGCSNGTSCFSTLTCVMNCGANGNCITACKKAGAIEMMSYQALFTCLDDACPSPTCLAPSPLVCDSALPPPASTACADCLTVACCDIAERCGASPACQACVAEHGGGSCDDDPNYPWYDNCRTASCYTVCP